jgi:RNA polymerase III subunit RPC82
MQGRQKIKDIIAALTDSNDVDYQTRLKSLHKMLTTLLDQQYLRTVNWWNLMPPDDLAHKISLEEEKKLRGSGTTSAGMASKTIKEAGKAAEKRLKSMKQDDKLMASLKRKPEEEVDIEAYRKSKRRRVLDDDDEEQQEFTWNVLL